MPGLYQQYPCKKFTKLIEEDYEKRQHEEFKKKQMAELTTHDRPTNERLAALEKLAIEVDRSNLINSAYQKLKFK